MNKIKRKTKHDVVSTIRLYRQQRTSTGRHEEVVIYLQSQALVNAMFQDIADYLQKWIPRFVDNDRVYLTVAIGCTGGQHRSVYMAERLSQHFTPQLDQVLVRHRELDKA